MRLRCPHCNSVSTILTSEAVSSTVTRHYVVCKNIDCGHSWRATTEADITLSPSAIPNAMVVLPLSAHIRRDVIMAQLRGPSTSEYEPRRPQPYTRDLFATDGPS